MANRDRTPLERVGCSGSSAAVRGIYTEALDTTAARIAEQCGAGGVDLIALGCGDAKREVKLAECLLQHGARNNIQDIRLFLLDISHSLLTEGHNHAKAVLGDRIKNIFALHGNFHDLYQYPLFNRGDLRTRSRVFTLLGCTLRIWTMK